MRGKRAIRRIDKIGAYINEYKYSLKKKMFNQKLLGKRHLIKNLTQTEKHQIGYFFLFLVCIYYCLYINPI